VTFEKQSDAFLEVGEAQYDFYEKMMRLMIISGVNDAGSSEEMLKKLQNFSSDFGKLKFSNKNNQRHAEIVKPLLEKFVSGLEQYLAAAKAYQNGNGKYPDSSVYRDAQDAYTDAVDEWSDELTFDADELNESINKLRDYLSQKAYEEN
jgi:hypothetical protein